MLRIATLTLLAASLVAADGTDERIMQVNATISSRAVALNQPVRIDFISLPRQVANIDIAQTVANAIILGGHGTWRLLGKPLAIEQDRTHTIEVIFSMLPRVGGALQIPTIPLTWLKGEEVAELGQVKVEDRILVNGELMPLPKECTGVGGFAWGTALADVRGVRLRDAAIDGTPERSVAHAKHGLDLVFHMGSLTEAHLAVPDLSLDDARVSFLSRWGTPQVEDAQGITWILGWTRITAAENPHGVALTLVREDLEDDLDHARIKAQVFAPLEADSDNGDAPAAHPTTPRAATTPMPDAPPGTAATSGETPRIPSDTTPESASH